MTEKHPYNFCVLLSMSNALRATVHTHTQTHACRAAWAPSFLKLGHVYSRFVFCTSAAMSKHCCQTCPILNLVFLQVLIFLSVILMVILGQLFICFAPFLCLGKNQP